MRRCVKFLQARVTLLCYDVVKNNLVFDRNVSEILYTVDFKKLSPLQPQILLRWPLPRMPPQHPGRIHAMIFSVVFRLPNAYQHLSSSDFSVCTGHKGTWRVIKPRRITDWKVRQTWRHWTYYSSARAKKAHKLQQGRRKNLFCYGWKTRRDMTKIRHVLDAHKGPTWPVIIAWLVFKSPNPPASASPLFG